MSETTCTPPTLQLQLHPTLLLIETANLDAVQVFLLDRSAPRKVRAAAARALFKQMGLKGISVTAPNYSMAQAVHIHLPNTEVPRELYAEWDLACRTDTGADTAYGQIRRREYAAEQKLEAILAKAFPNHLDRSDIHCDHFDYCWSVD
jgi:hypothetical protein